MLARLEGTRGGEGSRPPPPFPCAGEVKALDVLIRAGANLEAAHEKGGTALIAARWCRGSGAAGGSRAGPECAADSWKAGEHHGHQARLD